MSSSQHCFKRTDTVFDRGVALTINLIYYYKELQSCPFLSISLDFFHVRTKYRQSFSTKIFHVPGRLSKHLQNLSRSAYTAPQLFY